MHFDQLQRCRSRNSMVDELVQLTLFNFLVNNMVRGQRPVFPWLDNLLTQDNLLIDWLMSCGLLKTIRRCPDCRCNMKLNTRAQAIVKKVW